jgi:nucleotide-binding universal stress UspA family protein
MTNARGPVVVGVDGTPEARIATAIAAWEAARREVSLRLVHAHRPPDLAGSRERIDDRLRALTKELRDGYPGLIVETSVVSGGAAGTLVAASERASLVVVGTRARDGVRGHLAGSVAAQVATHASAPVIAVRTTHAWQADPDAFTGRPVVVGVDGSTESMSALAFAVGEAVARQAPLYAVYAWDVRDVHDVESIEEDPDYDVSLEAEKAERLLAEATGGWSERYPDLRIIRRPVHDLDPVETLTRFAADAGLVVVGSRGHGGFLGLRLGSTVDGLIRYAPVPVAVVRGTYDTPR